MKLTSKEHIWRVAAGYIVALMYTYGLSLSLATAYVLKVGPFEVLKYVALILLALSVLFYNKWTSIATIIVSAALAYWLFRYRDAASYIIETLIPFFRGTFDFLVGTAPLRAKYNLPLMILFIFVIALFARVSASRLRGCVSMLILALGVFIVEWYLGYKSILIAITFCAAAITSVFAYSYARRLFLRDMSDAEEDYTEQDELFNEGELIQHDRNTVKIPNASAIAIYSIPLALLAALLTAFIVPQSAGNYKSMVVESAIDDVVDFFGQYVGFSRKQYSFSLASLGYTSVTELGGPVNPSTSTALVVKGIAPSLIKGSTRSIYTGKGWYNPSETGSYRYNSTIWRIKRNEVFDTNRPSAEFDDQPGMLLRKVNLTISPYQNLYTIFSPTRPTSIRGGNKHFVPYFNDLGELFPKKRLDFFEPYTVTASQFMRLTDKVVKYIAELEKVVPDEDPEKMDELRNLYLQLPDTLPSSVRTLAKELASKADSDSQILQAMKIRNYFLDDFTYTLSPDKIPTDRDFVDYFLETKEGYCTYYASAMVVLARAAGIPARYVEGFLLTNLEHVENVYTVTGEEAHAWSELYFEGIGWVPFDATPIGQVQPTRPSSPTTLPDTNFPTPTPSISPETPELPEVQKERPQWVMPLTVFIVLVLINLALVLGHKYLYSRSFIVSKYGKTKAVEVWWRGILDMLPYQDPMFLRRPGESSFMLSERINSLVQNKVTTFDQIVKIVMRTYYGNIEPTDVEIDVVSRYHSAMENRMLKMMTPPVFAVRRVLFPRANKFRPKK